MLASKENRPQKLAAWRARLSKEVVSVPDGKGALWSGLGSGANAMAVARSLGVTTLEMTPLGASLDRGRMKEELDRDFGPAWIAEKRLVFQAASLRYLNALTGLVTVLLPENMARPRDGAEGSFAFNAKIIWDELRAADFGDPRTAIHRITAMRVCRIRSGIVVSDTFMSSSNQVH